MGFLIGTEDYTVEGALEVVRDSDADHLVRCLADTLDKKTEILTAIETFGPRTSYLQRASDKSLSFGVCKREHNGTH